MQIYTFKEKTHKNIQQYAHICQKPHNSLVFLFFRGIMSSNQGGL